MADTVWLANGDELEQIELLHMEDLIIDMYGMRVQAMDTSAHEIGERETNRDDD